MNMKLGGNRDGMRKNRMGPSHDLLVLFCCTRRVLCIGLLSCLQVFSEPGSESSPLSPPASSASSKALEQLNTGAWVNEFSGQAAFSVPLASISNHGGISFSVGLHYSGGGLEHHRLSKAKYNPISWVGEGFHLTSPSISVKHKGTMSLMDDEYFISLTGVSSTSLISEATVNSDVFYPSDNPTIKVQRVRQPVTMNLSDPNMSPGQGTLPPTSVPSVTTDQIVGWIVTLPDGSTQRFGAGFAACDINNAPIICLATTGDKIGYEPFYNYGTGSNTSRVPVQWFLQEIRSTDSQFAIFLEYEKNVDTVSGVIYDNGSVASPTVKADRAIYLRRIYSVNGTLTTDPKISTISLNREARVQADYYDHSAVDPLARFETERLNSVSTFVRDNTTPEVTLRLYYSPSGYSRTRLTDVKEVRESRERRLFTFTYDDVGGAPWRIKNVKAPNSAEWNYSYAPAAGTFSMDPQSLNLTTLNLNGTTVNPIADYVKPQVFMHQEVGNKLYLGLQEGSDCTSPSGNRWKRRLVELENFGTHWAVQRVFMSARVGCPDQNPVTLAPDGSYMAWSLDGNVRIYALTPSIGVGAIDLSTPPAGMQLLNENLQTTTGPSVIAEMFAYENWLAAYDRTAKRAVTFFNKTPTGWIRNRSTDCAEPLSPQASSHFEEGIDQAPWECLRWTTTGDIEVRGGNNFIAVKFNESFSSPFGLDNGSSIRIYAYRDGAVTEFKYGLRKSRVQVKGGLSQREPSVDNNGGMIDREFFWDPGMDGGPDEGLTILDLSVRNNLVGLVLGWRDHLEVGRPRYLYVFNFDGRQLRFLYQRTLAPPTSSFAAAHIFLGENYFLYRNEATSTFEYHYYNPRTWQVSAPITLAGSTNTSLKVLDGYFHAETITDRRKSFQPAVVSPTLDIYPGSASSGRLFSFDPAGGAPSQVNNLNPNPAPLGNQLFNVFQQGDRFLGISKNQSGSNTWTYSYLNMQASGNQVQWLPVPIGVSGMSATLITTGVMTMEQVVTSATDYKFSGVLRFHGDYGGALLNSSSLPPSVITRVEVLTKAAQSQIADGSLKRLDITYPSTPRLNHAGKVPNINQVVVTNVSGGRKNTSDYIVDYVPQDPALFPGRIFQGLVESTVLSNIPASGTGLRPGDASTGFHYKIKSTSTGWDGSTLLKESIKVPFLTKSTSNQYYFDASRATETRYALPSEKNGQPRIMVTKKGDDYYVSVVRFLHEFGTSLANALPAQTANYLFKGTDPCTGSSTDDPCSNLTDFDWLIPTSSDPDAPANAVRATSSTVFTYSSLGHLSSQYSWRSKQSSVSALTTLNGTTPVTDYLTQGKWIQESEVISRPSDHAPLLSRHGNPTVQDLRGVRTTIFYSGREGVVLATVQNASQAVCTFLDAEEEVTGSGRGAFGDWENVGVVSTAMAHTGNHSIQATTSYGPSVNVAFRRDADFWGRGKGLVVSGWMFVPSAGQDPNPAAFVELRPNAATAPISSIDILSRYKSDHSGAFPFDRWFKLEVEVTWDELNSIPFTESNPNSNPLIRVWFGKESPALNAHPVYIDDLRVHPSDAAMMSQTYDAVGRVTSRSNAENNPAFLQYDVWGGILSVKDDRGRLFSTTAYKRIED